MDIIYALLLALLQGSTEFLPVSSSGHLVVFSEIWGGAVQSLGFDIALHGSTLAAVLVYFRKDLRNMISGTVRGDKVQRTYMLSLFIATLPIAIIGPLLYEYAGTAFRSADVVAFALITSALFILIADSINRHPSATAAHPLRGAVVGLFQVFALLPGVSRAGITMAAGRLTGFSRETAVRFSFLLSIPTIAGAVLFAVLSTDISSVSEVEIHTLGIGLAATFVVAYAVIHYFLKCITRVGFAPFCLYQIVLGIALLL